MAAAKQGYARLPFAWHEDDVMWDVLSGEAVRLFLAMTLESALNLSDGWISARQTIHLARDNHEAIEELIEYQYLEEATREVRKAKLPGYLLIAFTKEQKTRQEREQEMAAARERQQRSRERSRARKTASKGSSGEAKDRSDVTGSVTRDSHVSHKTSRSSSSSEVEVKNPPLTLSSSVTSVSGSGRGASRRIDDGSREDATPASRTSSTGAHLHNSHNYNYSDNSAGAGAGPAASAERASARFQLPATPFESFMGSAAAELPPNGRPAEVNGSGVYSTPLLASQALSLMNRRISPERFVKKARRLVETKGWEHVDWAAMVEQERHSRANALRQGEAEALLPQLEAWVAEGAA